MTQSRQSNFELLRIVSMLLVLGFHAGHIALGSPKTSELIANPSNAVSLIFFEQFCAICINLFILISGYFGIHPTRKKLAALLFQIFFISALITIIAAMCGVDISIGHIMRTLIIGCDYWFVVSYLVLFIFAPALNQLFEHSNKKQGGLFLVAFFLLSTLYGFLMNDIGHFDYGFSPVWFLGIYSLARYVKTCPNRFFEFSPSVDLLIVLLCTVFSTLFSAIQIRMEITPVWVGSGISYNNPLIVIAALYFFLFFSKLSFYSKWINWLASGAFAIYLIHCHPLVFDHYASFAGFIYNNYSGIQYWGSIVSFLLLVAFSCILIDKIRLLVWNTISKPLFKQDAKQ